MKNGIFACSLAGAVFALTLAGCLGGGGGSSTPAVTAPTPAAPSPAVSRTDVQSADHAKSTRAVTQAANSLPRFGSVTQSVNAATGVTTDSASAAFDGSRLTVTVEREGKSDLVLDSNDAVPAFSFEPQTDTLFGIPGAARTLRRWGTLLYTENWATISGLAASSSDTDQSDWLAGGYWLHFTGDVARGAIAGAEAGAFVDGPELMESPASLPSSLTATFRGLGAGAYTFLYGTDVAAIEAPGSTEIGEFSGVATLTADFGNGTGTVRGCIGCEGTLSVDYFFRDARTEQWTPGTGTSAAAVHLGELSFDESGEFRGNRVTFSHRDLEAAGMRITEQGGSWGGRFSSRLIDGVPRLAAGTFGGEAASSGDTRAAFIGAFAAGKE